MWGKLLEREALCAEAQIERGREPCKKSGKSIPGKGIVSTKGLGQRKKGKPSMRFPGEARVVVE